MSHNPVERSAIRLDVVKDSRRNARLKFVLVNSTGEILLNSEEFKSTNPPKNESAERAILDQLLQNIRSEGWEIVARPADSQNWWAFQFAKGDEQAIERERQWAQMATPLDQATSAQSTHRETVVVEKKRGCMGGCLSGVGAMVVGLIGLVVVILVVGAMVGGDENDNGNDRSNVNEQGTPQEAKLGSGDNPAPIGTAITGDGLEITVHSGELSDTAGVLAGAEPGVLYLTLDVTIRNVSDDTKSFNALYWSAKDIVNGYTFDDDPFAGGSVNSLPSGELSPEDLVRGEVVIKIRDDSQQIRIKYDTSPFGGTNLYWLFEAP